MALSNVGKGLTVLILTAATTATVTVVYAFPCTWFASTIRHVTHQQSDQLLCTIPDAGYSIAISPDGQTLASADSQTIKLWNLRTGALSRTLAASSALSIAISPDGQILASGSQDQTIRLWNWRTGERIRTLNHSAPVIDIAFSPDGQTLSSGLDFGSQISLWNWRTGEPVHIADDPNHNKMGFDPFKTQPVAFSPDGQTFVANSGSGTSRLWNLRTGKLIRSFPVKSTVYAVAISPNGETLATAGRDKIIKLWNLRTGQLRRTLVGHSNELMTVVFSPDGQTLASGGWDNTVKIWSPLTGRLLHTFAGHSQKVWSVAFSPDSKTLASGSQDGTIKIWRVFP